MANKNGRGTIGNKGGGRKGYDYEIKELERMKKILASYFNLVEKKNKLEGLELDRFNRIEKVALKILDKRHANKTDIKLDVEKPIMIL
jgi:hypothetical protein